MGLRPCELAAHRTTDRPVREIKKTITEGGPVNRERWVEGKTEEEEEGKPGQQSWSSGKEESIERTTQALL